MSFFCTIAVLVPLIVVLTKTMVYKHNMANCIELFSVLNIVILFAVSWFTTTTGYFKRHPIRVYATYISVAVIMILFLSLILYQLINVLKHSVTNKTGQHTEQTASEAIQDENVSAQAPTSTTVELREPLLDPN